MKNKLTNSKEAKIKNIIEMAFDFSAMNRVFEKEKSKSKIIDKLEKAVCKVSAIGSRDEFEKIHRCFCNDFIKSVNQRDISRKASYGQAAKVLNMALKVYVYYCQLPDSAKAKTLTGLLHAAIDTQMLKHLKEYDRTIPASEARFDKDTYGKLQALVHKDIERNFPTGTLPVQWDDIMWRCLNKK